MNKGYSILDHEGGGMEKWSNLTLVWAHMPLFANVTFDLDLDHWDLWQAIWIIKFLATTLSEIWIIF